MTNKTKAYKYFICGFTSAYNYLQTVYIPWWEMHRCLIADQRDCLLQIYLSIIVKLLIGLDELNNIGNACILCDLDFGLCHSP